MALTRPQRAFGVFSNRYDAEGALQELYAEGFPMSQVSVISRETDKPIPVSRKAQDSTNMGAIAGGTVGGTLGLLVGLGTAAAIIPGVGPVVLLGAAATALATTLTTGVIGATAGGLIGALMNYGVPERQANYYRDRIEAGEFFLIIEATEADIRQAEAILSRWNVQSLRTYDMTAPEAI